MGKADGGHNHDTAHDEARDGILKDADAEEGRKRPAKEHEDCRDEETAEQLSA